MEARVKEKGILFNAEMVQAILSGRKMQTRRIISEKTLHLFGVAASAGQCHPIELCDDRSQSYYLEFCPLGKPGDQLWVRETFGKYRAAPSGIVYRADGELPCGDPERWTPSIHMPRWASRINLLITGVRVERLNDISDVDAMSEGIDADRLAESQDHYDCIADHNMTGRPTAKWYFSNLWQSIYGEENWEANPWVWVIEFERMEAK
ncbi:TPA: morphogenetic protein [Yersinia enterocolitica]